MEIEQSTSSNGFVVRPRQLPRQSRSYAAFPAYLPGLSLYGSIYSSSERTPAPVAEEPQPPTPPTPRIGLGVLSLEPLRYMRRRRRSSRSRG